MRRVSYQSVLEKASQLWTGESDPSAEDAATFNVFLNFRAGEQWEFYFWPELTPSERRQFRPNWNTTSTFAAPTATAAVEIYYAPSAKYYQSMQSSQGEPPALTSAYTENSVFWAESSDLYSGDDWATGRVLTVGTRVRNPSDNRYYQTVTAHTAGATFNSANFGILTPFVRNIDYEQTDLDSNGASVALTPIGEVVRVWDLDPYVYPRSRRCQQLFDLSDRGVLVRGNLPVVYPEYRLRVPSWTGAAYDAATSYALGAQVYDDTVGTGDFYRSLAASNLAHAVTDTAKWARIDFPYVLRDCAAQAAYADMLRTDGQNEKYLAELAVANEMLKREITKIELKQGQSAPLNVRSRN